MTAWVRHAVVLIGGFIAGSRAVEASEAWRVSRGLLTTDPSAADLYRTTAMLDVGIGALGIGIALLAWWLLRPPRGSRLP